MDQFSDFRSRPWRRLSRTIDYVLVTTYGTTVQADEAAERVRNMHRRVRGIDPVTGKPYAAEDHDLLLWVHAVEVDSYLEAFRAYGSGLTEADADRYVAERVRSVEALGLPHGRAPASVVDLKGYLTSMEDELVLSDSARGVRTLVMRSPVPRPFNVPLMLPGAAAAVILPARAREMYGLRWPWPVDRAVRAAARLACLTLEPLVPDAPVVRSAKRRARETPAA